jgi:hypothetical protein
VGEGAERRSREAGEGAFAATETFPLTRLGFAALNFATLSHKGRGEEAALHPIVITGLVPVIPMRRARCVPKRDGRNKSGHDKSRDFRDICCDFSNVVAIFATYRYDICILAFGQLHLCK